MMNFGNSFRPRVRLNTIPSLNNSLAAGSPTTLAEESAPPNLNTIFPSRFPSAARVTAAL